VGNRREALRTGEEVPDFRTGPSPSPYSPDRLLGHTVIIVFEDVPPRLGCVRAPPALGLGLVPGPLPVASDAVTHFQQVSFAASLLSYLRPCRMACPAKM